MVGIRLDVINIRMIDMSPLILWGGTDISPSIYNKRKLKYTQTPDVERDDKELFLIDKAIEYKTPIIGVCRGAQLLCAYTGGSLYQHVELQPMATVDIICSDGQTRKAKVDHHQVMKPNKDSVTIAWQYLNKPVKAHISDDHAIELQFIPQVVYWPKINAIGIQPHPEWMNKTDPFVKWINLLCHTLLGVNKHVFCN